jgi:hypothetical protein
MKKFITDNKIEFMKDTISLSWLAAYELDVATANKVPSMFTKGL